MIIPPSPVPSPSFTASAIYNCFVWFSIQVSKGGKDGKTEPLDSKKKPKNAFLLFSSDRRPQLKEEHGYPPRVMVSKLSEEWREMEGNGGRDVYERRAAELKEQWRLENAPLEAASTSRRKTAAGARVPAPASVL